MKKQLVLIDCQKDFCNPSGSLFVKGADEDMKRLATFINRTATDFQLIHATLDQHRTFSIFFTNFWLDKDGKNPPLINKDGQLNIVTLKGIEDGTWTTSNPKLLQRAKEYVIELEKKGKYSLCLWPRHCTWGSEGSAIESSVFEALSKYENDNRKIVNYSPKGLNPFTEFFGYLEAEVPDPQDPSTMFNHRLLNVLNSADEVYVAGEALSHCVSCSVRQMAILMDMKKVTLITDCCSSVPGFEKLGEDFIKELTDEGMKLAKSTEI